MHLLYVDESGSLENKNEPFVLGAIAIREDAINALRRRIDGILSTHLDPHLLTLELHATKIRSGSGPWHSIPKPVRDAVINDVLALLSEQTRDRRLFAVVRSPGAIPDVPPLERAYEELLLRFSTYLKHFDRPASCDTLGLVVADDAKYEHHLQPIVTAWREAGTRFGRLTRIVEVPLFVNSKATRLIQMADFVAHYVFLHYAKPSQMSAAALDRLLPAFDQTDKLHGLVHLTINHGSCSCHACSSRHPVSPK